jgi:hypothetical protein
VLFFGTELQYSTETIFMMQFLESIGVVQNETDKSFKMAPAVVMMILMLAFLGSMIYIFAGSLD